jgi:hypothetical protein
LLQTSLLVSESSLLSEDAPKEADAEVFAETLTKNNSSRWQPPMPWERKAITMNIQRGDQLEEY